MWLFARHAKSTVINEIAQGCVMSYGDRCLWCGVTGEWRNDLCDKCSTVAKRIEGPELLGKRCNKRGTENKSAALPQCIKDAIRHAIVYNEFELTSEQLCERFDLQARALPAAVGPDLWAIHVANKHKRSWRYFSEQVDAAMERHHVPGYQGVFNVYSKKEPTCGPDLQRG